MSDEEEIILSELDDDELVQQMHDDLYDGLQDEIREGVQILLERGWTPYDVLTKALVAPKQRLNFPTFATSKPPDVGQARLNLFFSRQRG